MTNKNSSPNAISHKDLNILLGKAKKENSLIHDSANHLDPSDEEFNDLISSWSDTSQKVLLMLNNKFHHQT